MYVCEASCYCYISTIMNPHTTTLVEFLYKKIIDYPIDPVDIRNKSDYL
jgi:hypothetical protein